MENDVSVFLRNTIIGIIYGDVFGGFMGRIRNSIRQNDLVQSLGRLRGNAKILLFVEPLWGVPINLISPFAAWYMYELGVSDMQIGFLVSIATVTQFLSASFAGVISDKLGRKKTNILGDFIGWTLACLVWAASQNVWFFLIAMVLNSFEQVNQTAWNCLLVEDTDKAETVNVYTWVLIAGLVSVFFAPISGVLIEHFGSVVPLMRGLYVFFAISMIVKNMITWKWTRETGQGLIRMEQTRGIPVLSLLKEYRTLIPLFFREKLTRNTLVFIILLHVTTIVNSSFFALYAIGTMGISKQYLAIFPILRSVLMMVFMFLILPKFSHLRLQVPVGTGLLIYIAAQVLLISNVSGNIPLMILYVIMDAVAFALVMPRRDSMLVLFTDEKERARSVSLLGALTLLISVPFGSFAGFLSSLDRRYPFAFSILMYVLALWVVMRMKVSPENSAEA